MKAMRENLSKLEAAIQEKDNECKAWYKDMEAKSIDVVAEKVKSEVAAFIRSRTVPRKVSESMSPSPSPSPKP
ncbi:hypothetical protein FRX31_033998 [Thalictrum thalictroides]|uniref:Uncharacterized protein n=1 Tax=Thalictrum thalictroides TaxID=46969 RepID=A0A7J6UW49_THATH|nr:hypothetical protein FRX31_033998 [Thalictrum thalictroides]